MSRGRDTEETLEVKPEMDSMSTLTKNMVDDSGADEETLSKTGLESAHMVGSSDKYAVQQYEQFGQCLNLGTHEDSINNTLQLPQGGRWGGVVLRPHRYRLRQCNCHTWAVRLIASFPVGIVCTQGTNVLWFVLDRGVVARDTGSMAPGHPGADHIGLAAPTPSGRIGSVVGAPSNG